MKKVLIIFICIFSFIKLGYSIDNVYFNFDYAVFKSDDQKSILEIYYSVNQKSLNYLKVDDKFEAAAKINIAITEVSTNAVIISKTFKTPSVISDTTDKNLNQKLVGQLNFLLPDGNYKIEITGSDFNDSLKSEIIKEDININYHSSPSLKFSDIELADNIQKSGNEKSIFYKNTLEIIPNPAGLFGMNLNNIYYYYEVYGITSDNISENYKINLSVVSLNNEKLISFDKIFKRGMESKADFGKINTDSLPRGSYKLIVSISDSLKNVNLTKEKNFFIFKNNINTPVVKGQDSYLKSEYLIMDEKDLENEFEYAGYIMTDKEKSNYDKLTNIDNRRKFMYNFWKARDNNLSTQVVEYKTAYLKRISDANKFYKESYKVGWKTDRGRIYVLYGKPDEIERFPFESNSKSYETWQYSSSVNRGECVFIERIQSSGVYSLAHSTLKSELNNPNWERELR